ncbi:MAG: 4-(cytidine 5'-diphospho)-2-C-methyl-D-erythritol kinase [Ruminococcaceae bacterium]|nr:4-(cytidine 5'-diphospho)-2-C-methyl-D-erythritol kinase [Oscillospiraceae bacterium]
MKLTYNAYAKINLILDVTGVKQNGYHTLFTVMQSIGLKDVISVEKTKGEKITISCTDESVPTDSKNIVYKCAVKFFEHFRIEKNKGVHIHIEKNIPHEAGLGGGSADGAAVLVALNEIFNTNASKRTLMFIGGKVGADIPFCIVGGTALCQDIGTVVAPLPDIDECSIVVVKPESGSSTVKAYDAIDEMGERMKHTKNNEMLELLLEENFKEALKYCDNVFEQVIEVPDRADIKHILRKNNSSAACMSGSGSAIFGIFFSKEDAENAKKELEKKYSKVYLCDGKTSGVEKSQE